MLHDRELQTTIEDKDLPDHINGYFITIGEKMANRIKHKTGSTHANIDMAYRTPHISVEHDYTPIKTEEVITLINRIDINKLSGISNIRTVVLKDAFKLMPDRITKLFNASLAKELFPEKWKAARVVPLPKKLHVTEVTDLRPVSLLPLPGKLLERLVCDRLLKFLETNKLLSEQQHGFRTGKSTISAMTDLLNRIYDNINNSIVGGCPTTFQNTEYMYIVSRPAGRG